jgi:hypothetical protein
MFLLFPESINNFLSVYFSFFYFDDLQKLMSHSNPWYSEKSYWVLNRTFYSHFPSYTRASPNFSYSSTWIFSFWLIFPAPQMDSLFFVWTFWYLWPSYLLLIDSLILEFSSFVFEFKTLA